MNSNSLKNKRVVLISLYDLDSLPVRTLHASLTKHGFEAHSIFFKSQNIDNTMDYPTEADISVLLKKIDDLDPLFVGISLRSTLYQVGVQLTNEIKKRREYMVIWGGIHPTIRPEQCLQTADAVCVGEGDEAIVEIAGALAQGNSIENIKNIWVRNKDSIIKNPLRPLMQDLDSLPFPDYTNDNKWYIDNGQILSQLPGILENRSIYWVMTSRGCIFNCTYCCNSTLKKTYKGYGKYLRRRSPQNVVDELVSIKKIVPQLAFIVFVDDIFVYDLEWLKEFAQLYKEKISIPFCCYFHTKVIREELAAVLKDAGVEFMMAGIQSGSEEVRKRYFQRFETNETIISATRILQKYDIDIVYNIILDNPLETDKDRMKTLELLTRIPLPYEMQPTSLTHFPETPLTNMLLKKGLIREEDVEDQKQKSFNRWSLILDYTNDEENLFWENLYFLANKLYMPTSLLILAGHLKVLKRFSRQMTKLIIEMVPYLNTGTISQRLQEITHNMIVHNPEPNRQFQRFIQLIRPLKPHVKKIIVNGRRNNLRRNDR